MNGPIVLTTDFGHTDDYVGVVKGVILSINPAVRIIDHCHSVPPQDINRAAHLIGYNRRYFPAGSIHLCIVDPGVGTSRRIIVIKDAARCYIGPDNGVFSSVLRGTEALEIYKLANQSWFLHTPSATFHGRDIMAPAAARISLGKAIEDAGPRIEPASCVVMNDTAPLCEGNQIIGEIIHIDHFGNMITNIEQKQLSGLAGTGEITVHLQSTPIPFKPGSYEELKENQLSAIINSSSLLEICVKNGNGADISQGRRGDRVIISRDKDSTHQ